jgi:hypothetical protein
MKLSILNTFSSTGITEPMIHADIRQVTRHKVYTGTWFHWTLTNHNYK